MKFIADFHIHSKYSRATSPLMDLENIAKAAETKGLQVIGTGDFTHPAWFDELKEQLVPAEQGLYKLKNQENPTRFILTAEISCIYSKAGAVRKIHILIFAPDFETVEKINASLDKIGNLKADGRPILGLDAKELAKIALNANEKCLVIPSHCLTPWFAIFGSKSGFDSIKECFEDYSKYIYAMETGLSADPAMIWRIPDGRKLTLISCGDAHSLPKLGREACVFDTDLSYDSIAKVIKEKDNSKFLYTIEFFPEEGLYLFDGHRKCDICFSPAETKKHQGICPVCGKPLVVGVLNRVGTIADKPEGFKPTNVIPYKSLIPLQGIIAEVVSVGVQSKKVQGLYKETIKKLGPELHILLDEPIENIKKQGLPEIAEAISRVRQGRVHLEPGYDGVYGKVKIFSDVEKKALSTQKTLF